MRGLEVIYTYMERLDQYTIEQLRYRMMPGTWSIGQVYSHIVDVALEYLDNVKQCAESCSEQPLGKTEAGDRVFGEGAFPPVKIKLPEGMEYSPNDAKNKEDHLHDLNHLIDNMRVWDLRIMAIHPLYKVRHGGFGWLNAREWHDLIEMHTRHHLRQLKEIEEQWNKVTVDR